MILQVTFDRTMLAAMRLSQPTAAVAPFARLAAIGLLLVAAGCGNEPVAPAGAGSEPAPPPDEPHGTELFGSALTRDVSFVAFDDLIADPDAFVGEVIQTSGVVRANCNKRGCWMEVRSPDDAASPGLTVRFVDYSFFIPLDSRGAQVKVQGETSVQILDPDEVADLISEGYDSGVALPDGSAKVLTFVATGVEMTGR
jgi:hypothetical protein